MTGYCNGDVINNIPTPNGARFIVARLADTEHWYYGAYDSLSKALDVADQVHGKVFDLADLLLVSFTKKEEI